ncbi:hypothetical protein AWB67_07021 [Caballeronia terrestris]|uniref:Uncharacterized protein n=1 Tax=Caballeronia terrestris TaxID=1226301 RepID=A0A158KXN9_9BURK|nr:hypothetical protein AWB67_07021 [Caballeronia terrestris]
MRDNSYLRQSYLSRNFLRFDLENPLSVTGLRIL